MSDSSLDHNVPAQQYAEDGEGRAGRIEVTGPPHSVVFPPLCVRCGIPANQSVRFTKVFRRYREDVTYPFGVYSMNAPVCGPCLEAHRQEEQPPEPAIRRQRLRRWFWEALFPYTLPLAALGILTYLLGPSLASLIAQRYRISTMLVWGGVACAFAVLAVLFCAASVLRGGYRLFATGPGNGSTWNARIERGPFGARLILPIEPTDVTSSVNFSDDIGDILAGERHRYWFRNDVVAARFQEANANRIWNPRLPRARISYATWLTLFVVLILLTLVAMFGDIVGVRLPWDDGR